MDEQFEKWLAQSDEALKELGGDKKISKQPTTSFYNNAPTQQDYEQIEDNFDQTGADWQDPDDWNAIYRRALEFGESENQDDLLVEKEEKEDGDMTSMGWDDRDGFSHMVRGDKQQTKGDITYTSQPQKQNSVGPDAGKEYGGPMRVTKNWSTGPETLEIDEIKHDIEALERMAHKAEVNKKPGERDKIYKQLEGLRQRVSSLSEKQQSKPEFDVT